VLMSHFNNLLEVRTIGDLFNFIYYVWVRGFLACVSVVIV